MEIHIDLHTLERAAERGTSEEEIKDVIRTRLSVTAKYGRLGKGKIFRFQRTWRGRFYEQKRVEVFYVTEDDAIVTVTAHVFYGQWEGEDADPL